MTIEELKRLYPRVLNGEVNDAELEALSAYFKSADPAALQQMIQLELKSEVPMMTTEAQMAAIDQRVLSHLRAVIAADQVPVKRISIWPRVAVAAAIATIVFGAGLFYYQTQSPKTTDNLTKVQTQDVPPGKVGATLTLASGKKIKLTESTNGELTKEAGVTITKTKDGQLVYKTTASQNNENRTNTLSTEKGETYQVILPDGSLAILNAASSITYHTNLIQDGKRSIKLTGESYFEIAKDKAHPFIVETQNQQVEVLGTHFNINSYQDEPSIKTTLLEGRVKITATTNQLQSNKPASILLSPGEQASLQNDKLSKQQIDTELAVAWKNNKFIFESDDIQYIMRMVARWYNLEVTYIGDIPENKFGGAVSRFDNVSKVLKKLEATGKVKFKIEGRRIMVSK